MYMSSAFVIHCSQYYWCTTIVNKYGEEPVENDNSSSKMTKINENLRTLRLERQKS